MARYRRRTAQEIFPDLGLFSSVVSHHALSNPLAVSIIIEVSQLLGGILSLGRRKGKIWILLALSAGSKNETPAETAFESS